MRQKKRLWYLLIMIVVFFSLNLSLEATEMVPQEQEVEEQQITQQVLEESMKLFDWQSIEEAEEKLRASLPEGVTFDLKDEMSQMLRGQSQYNLSSILQLIVKGLWGEIGTFLQFGSRFVLIVLLCNLLQMLSSSFKSKHTTTIGFFVCYMAILLSVVQSFKIMTQLATQVIDHLNQVMLICVPTLLAFMVSTGYVASATAMAPVIISSLSLMSYLIKVIILPCIVSVVVLEVLSAMSQEFKVDKWIALFYKGIKWTLNTLMGVSIGLLGLYRWVLPGVDTTVKKATVKFSTAFIPVVGSALGGAIEFITQGANLIKNTFSASVMIWILLLLSIPLIKILAYVCVYQVAGAIIEPIGDKKMANIATKLGKGSQFIMSCVGIVALFCICSLVICMTIGASSF